MRDIKNKLTTGKNTKTIQQRRAKGFGYQVLGFGAGGSGPPFVEASGGTITTTGDYKIHTFASPGTFTVTNAGSATEGIVDYFVVAGGGGGGNNGYPQQRAGGAGGGGGFRLSNATAQVAAPVMSPLSAPAGLNVTAQGYPITVGAGGVGGAPATNSGAFAGFIGASSIFSSITSTGGGGGGGHPLISGGPSPVPGGPHDGGSGASDVSPGRGGNTPPTSPPQGNNGGNGVAQPPATFSAGGGGGAGGVGGNSSGQSGGNGGIGSFVADAVGSATPTAYGTPGPVGSTRYFSGGGGGINGGNGSPAGGGTAWAGPDAAANTGGGGGGNQFNNGNACTGGSGIVILRYKYQ